MTNKLTLVMKKTQKNTKSKPTGPGSPVRTIHTNVHVIRYNCGTQYGTEQF